MCVEREREREREQQLIHMCKYICMHIAVPWGGHGAEAIPYHNILYYTILCYATLSYTII